MNEAIRPGPESPLQAAMAPQLSVVVPTFNERDNVTTLYRRLENAALVPDVRLGMSKGCGYTQAP